MSRPQLVKLLKQDARMLVHDLLVNRLLASALLPRMARHLILRALGYPIHGVMLPGVTIVGPLRNLTMGVGSGLNRRCFVDLSAPITIGTGTGIGMDTVIVTSDHPIDDRGRWSLRTQPKPIVIGDHVWIGAKVVICPGAVIESDIVIAAGAVVAGRLESGGIYGGTPARRIGTRTISGSI